MKKFKYVKTRRIEKQEIQARMEKLLQELKEVFEEHNLRYYLWGGTLIGAALYKGFIPWDDDIDIGMPREDYNKLIELARQGKLKNTLWCNELNKNYKYLFAKYCEDGTLIEEKYTNAGQIGLFVDIFPVNGLGNTWEEARRTHKRIKPWHYLYWASITPMKIRWLLLIPPVTPLFFAWKFLFKKMNKIYKEKDFDTNKYVGMMGVKIRDREIYERIWFDDGGELPFNGVMYSAPNHNERLDRNYGPRWRIPQPEEERVIHDFKAWEIKIVEKKKKGS